MLLPVDVKRQIISLDKGPPPPIHPPYPSGTKLEFHFRTVLEEDDGEEGDIIDDSRKHKSPMFLILGKEFKIPVWEQMLNTMKKGELVKFTVPKHHVSAYPFVAKTIRTTNTDQKPSVHSNHHCCGMMARAGGEGVIGYPDLDHLLEHPHNLIFYFDLISVSPPESYEKEGWQLTEDERKDSIPALQKEGNSLFGQGDIEGAEKKYFEAISRLETLLLKEHPESEEAHQLKAQKAPILLNYAFCLMKGKSEYYEAINHLTDVLQIQPENVKALFRRGKCHKEVGNWEEAQQDFEDAMKLDPSLQSAVNQLLKEMMEEQKAKNEKERKQFKKLF